jgi:hypothetical protein
MMAKMRDWTRDLPPYAPDAPCPKCGHPITGTRYCVNARPSGPGEACSPIGYNKAEHLDRECDRCRYEWAEQVLASASLSPAQFVAAWQEEGP